MIKRELERKKYLKGSLRLDQDNLAVYFIEKESQIEILLTDGAKVMLKEMSEAEYKNITTLGLFRNNKESIDVDAIENKNIYLQKSINPGLKEFLKTYIDSNTLSFLMKKLKKYEVTLYDCVFFIPYENHTEKNYITGTNSIQFYSDETYGYCYLIHKFRIDENMGISIFNDFEFISIEGDKQNYKREIELNNEAVLTEDEELEKHFLEYYEGKFTKEND